MQNLKAPDPIRVQYDKSIDVNPVHDLKAAPPIVNSVVGKVIDVKLETTLKALSPILTGPITTIFVDVVIVIDWISAWLISASTLEENVTVSPDIVGVRALKKTLVFSIR